MRNRKIAKQRIGKHEASWLLVITLLQPIPPPLSLFRHDAVVDGQHDELSFIARSYCSKVLPEKNWPLCSWDSHTSGHARVWDVEVWETRVLWVLAVGAGEVRMREEVEEESGDDLKSKI